MTRKKNVLILLCFVFALFAAEAKPIVVYFTTGDIQNTIDKAAPNSIIICDKSYQLVVDKTILVSKPIVLKNLNAKISDGVGKTTLICVTAEGVSFENLLLTGNHGTIPVEDRKPLIHVAAGNFVIRDCDFYNGSKDGLMISADGLDKDISDVYVENIRGYGCWADVVSISGDNADGGRMIRNVTVQTVKCYGSVARGGVEVSDGSENINVFDVYAENAWYAVDIQDHNSSNQINKYISISNVYAQDCRHAIVTRNRDFGHSLLSLSNITAIHCEQALNIRNTKNLVIYNVFIDGMAKNKYAVLLTNNHTVNCSGFVFENVDEHHQVAFQKCTEIKADFVYDER